MKPVLRENEVAFPCYESGTALGDEPPAWLVVDRLTKTQRHVTNRDYVAPPEPTERDKAYWRVRDAQQRLFKARRELADAEKAYRDFDG